MTDPKTDVFVQHLADVLEQLRETLRLQDREISATTARLELTQESLNRIIDILQGTHGENLVTRMRVAEEILARVTQIEDGNKKGKYRIYAAAIPGVLALAGHLITTYAK